MQFFPGMFHPNIDINRKKVLHFSTTMRSGAMIRDWIEAVQKGIFTTNLHMKLFVAGLPPDIDSTDLKEMFELYGSVVEARVVTDRTTRASKGFGFVEFSSSAEATEAMQLLDGKTIRGKTLVLKPAEERS
jgi:cold-inducible RNA-binding protein